MYYKADIKVADIGVFRRNEIAGRTQSEWKTIILLVLRLFIVCLPSASILRVLKKDSDLCAPVPTNSLTHWKRRHLTKDKYPFVPAGIYSGIDASLLES